MCQSHRPQQQQQQQQQPSGQVLAAAAAQERPAGRRLPQRPAARPPRETRARGGRESGPTRRPGDRPRAPHRRHGIRLGLLPVHSGQLPQVIQAHLWLCECDQGKMSMYYD